VHTINVSTVMSLLLRINSIFCKELLKKGEDTRMELLPQPLPVQLLYW